MTSWAQAWRSASTGPRGFYRTHKAEDEFRTSIHVDSSVADTLAAFVHAACQQSAPAEFAVIDVGSGSGQLLADLAKCLPPGCSYVGIDIRPRPTGLPEPIEWIQRTIDETTENITGRDGNLAGVLIAHEFLDDIPCDVVELDENLRPRLVLVDPATGREEIGPGLADPACVRYLESPNEALAWLERWWPPTRPLARREIGLARDRVWARLRRVLASGTAIAIDYGHRHSDRATGLWDAGTIKGFAAGRVRRPIPDGSCNITANVALDSCAGPGARLTQQADHVSATSAAGFPWGLGAYDWLIEPIVER